LSRPNYIDRPPRIQPELPAGQFDIPNPPQIEEQANQVLIQVALPLISVVGYILVSTMSKGRSMVMIIPMALAVVASTLVAVYSYRQAKKLRQVMEAAYAQRLVELRREMETYHEMQRTFYQYNYPEPETTLRIAEDLGKDSANRKEDSRSGSRLWERRSTDSDFGVMRLGISTVGSTVTYKMPNVENFDDPLVRDAIRLSDDSLYVSDVSVVIPLRQPPQRVGEESKLLARHAVGIAGHSPDIVYEFMRGLLVDFSAFHSPTDASIFVVGSYASRQNWRWAYSLPHAKSGTQIENLTFETETDKRSETEPDRVALFWKSLRTTLERRKVRLADKDSGDDITLPFLLVVVDVMSSVPEWSSMHDLESNPAINLILKEGYILGAAVLFLVPERSKVPGACVSVLEIDQDTAAGTASVFRYAEVNVNSPRFVGRVGAIASQDAAREFARALEPLVVRRTYGADLATSVTLLEMMGSGAVDELLKQIEVVWPKTRDPKSADWLGVNVGVMSGNEVRRLGFSAKADGVHGMVAGSTGSGKSELLTTLILGLALSYDPSVVNFVLVDYKGGSAFEPFRNLPHVVDIVTNLEGSATARMFASIKAELDRRQRLNTYTNSKDIVHYRKQGLHLKEGAPPYPFMFIIIDEFAEMIAGNSEFKSQLESITRLGRALGVHLILAAQRPIGVTDQMRANIKFRICLRVETPEDSRELLRRSDAAFLPPGIPGRGYLQVGNENIELIQTAYSGGDYRGPQENVRPNVIWLNRAKKADKLVEPPKLQDVIVDRLTDLYKAESRKPQWRPWPAFLPRSISLQSRLDMGYMTDNDVNMLRVEDQALPDDTQSASAPAQGEAGAAAPARDLQAGSLRLPLNGAVVRWINGETRWRGINWEERAMRPVLGLVDNPYDARQTPLVLEFPVGHGVIFGASGWGKTTFLRTLMISLMATHSPDELQIYILDFGGRNLAVLTEFPHVGAVITSDEEERIQRLIRKLTDILEHRQSRLSEAGATDLYSYNSRHPEAPVPAILVVIDNFAEFKENFDSLMPSLTSLVRDARAYGIHFVVTADLPNALPNKLFSLFTERMTLKLSDPTEYTTVVGRGVPDISAIAGRGYVRMGRIPLEFQVALPVMVDPEDMAKGLDETEKIKRLAVVMRDTWGGAWKSEKPSSIETLPIKIPLEKVFQLLPAQSTVKRLMPAIGLDDLNLELFRLDLQRQGPNLLIIGPPNSGKTTTLRTIALSLAYTYGPNEVMMVLIDFQRRFFEYGGKNNLGQLPQVVQTINRPDQLEEFSANLQAEVRDFNTNPSRRKIYVLIDNYDSFSDEGYRKSRKAFEDTAVLMREFGTAGFHFIACGSLSVTTASEDIRKQVTASSYSMGLQSVDAVTKLNGKVPRSLADAELPYGRGFVVKSGRTAMLQIGTPYSNDENIEPSLDAWVDQVRARFPGPQATWLRQAEPAKDGGGQPASSTAAPGAPAAAAAAPIDLEELKKQLKEKGVGEGLLGLLGSAELLSMAATYGIIKKG
jgi:DNA segregation ATPase FtsK/SpoIIIE-like protein